MLVIKIILNVINYFNELKNAYKPKYSDDELITIFEDDKPIKHKNKKHKRILQLKISKHINQNLIKYRNQNLINTGTKT